MMEASEEIVQPPTYESVLMEADTSNAIDTSVGAGGRNNTSGGGEGGGDGGNGNGNGNGGGDDGDGGDDDDDDDTIDPETRKVLGGYVQELTKTISGARKFATELYLGMTEVMLILEQAVSNTELEPTKNLHRTLACQVVQLLANMTEHTVLRNKRLRAASMSDYAQSVQTVSSVIFQADPVPALVALMRGRKQKGNRFRSTAELSSGADWFKH